MEHDVKDMLEIAIANNDSLWEVAVIVRLQDELERLYSQEAKAKAFDRISEEVKLTKFDIFEKELIDEDTGYLALGKELARFVTKYERTECND